MKFLNFFKNLFKKKEKEEQKKEEGLIIETGLPDIPSRIPLVFPVNSRIKNEEATTNSVENNHLRTCSLCKFAVHDPELGEIKEIICTLDPVKPILQKLDYSCLDYKARYQNIKVIVDNGHLMEYDSEKTGKVKSNIIPDKAIEIIGEEQWDQ